MCTLFTGRKLPRLDKMKAVHSPSHVSRHFVPDQGRLGWICHIWTLRLRTAESYSSSPSPLIKHLVLAAHGAWAYEPIVDCALLAARFKDVQLVPVALDDGPNHQLRPCVCRVHLPVRGP